MFPILIQKTPPSLCCNNGDMTINLKHVLSLLHGRRELQCETKKVDNCVNLFDVLEHISNITTLKEMSGIMANQ